MHYKNIRKLDELSARGHMNVLSTHQTTLEITTEDFLTRRGNCIIAINGTKAVADFSQKLKNAIQKEKKIYVHLKSGPFEDNFQGYGHKELTLTNQVSMVFRKSNFISDRTALIRCNKASMDLNRKLVEYLQIPSHRLYISLYVDEI
jgi:hypothetical protein